MDATVAIRPIQLDFLGASMISVSSLDKCWFWFHI